MRPADKELTHAVRALRDPRAWVGGAFLGPSPSVPALPLTPRAQSFAAATTPAKIELSLDQVG